MLTLDKCPPAALLDQAATTGNLEHLEQWFINQRSPGYSFQTIVDFVAERRSQVNSKAKRAPSAKKTTRKTPTKKEEVPQL